VITESHGTTPAPVFVRDGEPCPSCGAPLAGDQRYCLHCGARRPEARLEFLDVLDEDVRARRAAPPAFASTVDAAASPPTGLIGRLNANAGLLAIAALLVLTLLIGLLLGHWVTQRDTTSAPGSAAAPAPQVIKVEGTVAAPTASAPADTSGDDDSSGTSSASKSKATKSRGASDTAKAPKDSVSVKNLDSKKAVDDAVKKGKPISTGTGALPPKDDKAAGGGSDFEEIG
jgi:hypothetical protein